MIIFDPGAGEPTQWFVCFQRHATAWVERLPIGRYKHVAAFALVPYINTWIFVDVCLDRTSIKIARGDAAKVLIGAFATDAMVVQMPARSRTTLLPRLGGWCVPAVKHLIGLRSGALRPDALLRDCLRNGGEIAAADEDFRADLYAAAA